MFFPLANTSWEECESFRGRFSDIVSNGNYQTARHRARTCGQGCPRGQPTFLWKIKNIGDARCSCTFEAIGSTAPITEEVRFAGEVILGHGNHPIPYTMNVSRGASLESRFSTNTTLTVFQNTRLETGKCLEIVVSEIPERSSKLVFAKALPGPAGERWKILCFLKAD